MALFQPGYGHAARVGGFAGGVEDASVAESTYASGFGRHVGSFGDGHDSVAQERFGFFFIEFVLCSAGEGDLTGDMPRAFAFVKFGFWKQFGVFVDAFSPDFFEVLDDFEFFGIDAFRIIDKSTGIRKGQDLCTEFECFFDGVMATFPEPLTATVFPSRESPLRSSMFWQK